MGAWGWWGGPLDAAGLALLRTDRTASDNNEHANCTANVFDTASLRFSSSCFCFLCIISERNVTNT
jgi:hypothetical protein